MDEQGRTPRGEALSARTGARYARLFIFTTVFVMTEVDLLTRRQWFGPHAPELHLVSLIGLAWVIVSSLSAVAPKRDQARVDVLALTCDVIMITAFLHLTGGPNSNYYPLYYLPILQACVRLSVRDAIAAAVLCVGSYAILGYVGGINAELTTTAGFRLLTFGLSALFMALFFAVLIRETRDKEEQIYRTSELLRRVTVMYEMAQALGTTLDRDRLGDAAAGCAARAVEAEAGAVYLADASGKRLELVAVAGPPELRQHIELGSASSEWAYRAFRSGQEDTTAPGDHGVLQPPLQSVISVAFHRTQGVAGVLQAFNKQAGAPFSAEDYEVLISLASQAAAGLENVQLVKELRDKLQELNATYARLAQSEKLSALGKLIAGIAHELNNPLAAVMGYAELMGQDALPPRASSRLEQVYLAASRCKKIVDSLLAFARKEEPEMAPADLNELMTEALAAIRTAVAERQIEVRAELDPELPTTAADAHQIRQVFVNLLTNAAQALSQVEPPRQLRVATRREGRDILVVVSDSGPGIPPEIRGRVFDPFFTTRPPGEGTGLGLSLAYGVIAAHRGTISFEPNHPCGSTFLVRLPVHVVPRSEGAAEPDAAASPAIQGRILLIEDDEPVAAMVAEALGEAGGELVRVTDGAEGLRLVGQRPFDAIIADMNSAGLTGPDFLRQLRHRSPDQAARVIFLIGDTVSPTTVDFLSGLDTPYLTKPFRLAELRATVWRVCRRPHTAGQPASDPRP